MSQSPYGQTPPPGQPYGQGYGSAPQYDPNLPYGAPVQGYVTAGPQVAMDVRKPSTLGFLGLLLVVVCTAILCMATWKMGSLTGPYMYSTTTGQLATDIGALWPMLMVVSCAVGIVGWIIGIVATATKRGRMLGIFAIILGAVAPGLGFLAYFLALLPYARQ